MNTASPGLPAQETLIGRIAIERRIGAAPTIGVDEPYGHLVLVVIGEGGVCRDTTFIVSARVIGEGAQESLSPRRMDVLGVKMIATGRGLGFIAEAAAAEADQLSRATIAVDIAGEGIHVAKILVQMCPNVIFVNWGHPNVRDSYRARFHNQRAQCNVHLAQAIDQGRVTFRAEHADRLLDQGEKIFFGFNEAASYQLLSKVEMFAADIPSPDFWDVLSLGFLEDVGYIPASKAAQPVAAPADPTAAVVLKLRNLADSIEGGTGADAISVKSAVLIIESGSGELLPFTIGDNEWADHPGILFLGNGQVELVSVDDLQC